VQFLRGWYVVGALPFLLCYVLGLWVGVGWFTAYTLHLPLVEYGWGFVATFKKNTPFFVATFEIINLTL
jgi:hypothetical protein